jgi:peptidyl-prolyl cis-trans isomerase D
MLEQIRNNTQSKLAKIILGIIIVPFALFGIDSYLSSAGTNVYVAKVNGKSISVQSFQNSLLKVREQITSKGSSPDPSMFESQEFRKAVLDGLITSLLVNQEIKKSNFTISKQQLSEYIIGMPAFQKNGKFDQDMYDQIAQNANLTPRKLDEEIRKDLAKQQVKDSLSNLIYVSEEKIKPLVNLAYQKRDISLFEMRLDDYKEKVKISEGDINKFYSENTSLFIMPDQVKFNFLVYSVAGIIPQISVTDDEVKNYFSKNLNKLQDSQQRKAKHILFGFNQDINAGAKERVKAKAEGILTKLKKNPKKFSEFAKKYSEDPESAKKGGDLGFFSRGLMVKEFDDVVFNMKVNNISEIIETQFGFHIIMLTEIKGEEVTFDSVKAQIKGELIFSKAQEIYANGAEDFNNIVYEQSDSLKPVADIFNLEIQESQWHTINSSKKFFNNEFFSQAIFDKNSIEGKKNIAAIEVSPNNLISARVINFKKSSVRPIKEVRQEIEDILVERSAQKLLIEKGDNLIELLKLKNKDIEWVDELVIDRIDMKGLSESLVKAIFKIDNKNIPNYEGIYDPNKNEYIIVKLNKVINESIDDELSLEIYRDEYLVALKNQLDEAYIQDLRSEASIKYNMKFLNILNN